jgi:hypothetical protein
MGLDSTVDYERDYYANNYPSELYSIKSGAVSNKLQQPIQNVSGEISSAFIHSILRSHIKMSCNSTSVAPKRHNFKPR